MIVCENWSQYLSIGLYGSLRWLTAITPNLLHTPWTYNIHTPYGPCMGVCMAFRCYWYWDCYGTVSEQLGVIKKDMYLSPTYLTYSVLITISIYTFIPLPEDFWLWKKLWKIMCLLTASQWHIICGYCWCSGQWWCIRKALTCFSAAPFSHLNTWYVSTLCAID